LEATLTVLPVHLDYSDRKVFHFGLFSDIHFGGRDFDKKLFLHDINEAVEHDALIFINGDTFDAIFPTDHKRYTKSGDIAKHDAAINEIMESAEAFFAPYADYIYEIGMGNHEVSCIKFNNFDPVRDLVARLNRHRSPSLPAIRQGGFRGYIRVYFRHGENRRTRRYDIFRFHGAGGSAPVTKGMIDVARVITTYDADLYWMGHKHTSISDDCLWKVGVNSKDKIFKKRRRAIFTGSYKRAVRNDVIDDTHGYRSDYGEERMLTLQAEGYKLLRIDLGGDDLQARMIA
jgi:hypothetical protein